MNLSQEDVQLFYKLWFGLLYFVNQKHNIVKPFKKPVYGVPVDASPFFAIREQLWENPQWIDDFLREGDGGEFTLTDREILSSWREHFVSGKFFIMKHSAKHSLFMPAKDANALYAVVGISDPISEALSHGTPVMVSAVLLPFKGKIIYDSFLKSYAVTFGGGIKASLRESCRKTEEKFGIFEKLDGSPAAPAAVRKAKPAPAARAETETGQVPPELQKLRLPKAMIPRYQEISAIIAQFCDEKLNDEYKRITLHTLAKLCRKRPSPLERGRARTWACGIVHAIASNNFLFDKSQTPNMTATEISAWFGLAKSTAGSKAAEVSEILGIDYFTPEFCIQSILASNPTLWFLSVNGVITDLRTAPRALQEEAFARGLIPFIPD